MSDEKKNVVEDQEVETVDSNKDKKVEIKIEEKSEAGGCCGGCS